MPEIIIKKRLIWQYFPTLSSISAKGTKFNFVLALARQVYEPVYNALLAAAKPSKEFLQFQQQATTLRQKHENEELTQKEFIDALKQLESKYEEAIQERAQQVMEFEKLLDEEITLSIPQISLEEAPQDLDTQAVMALTYLNILTGAIA